MHRLCTYICVCTQMRASSGVRLRGWGVGVGLGVGLGLGLELVQPWGLPEARQGSHRRRPWFPGSQMRRGSRAARRQPRSPAGVGAPATHPPGGVGAAGAQELGRGAGAKGEGRQRAYSTWYSQAVSHPSTNQARPCLASEIRLDRARSGWYGLRRRLLPPGALRALCCASLSFWPAGQPFCLQVILLPPLSLPTFWESPSFHTWWCNEWMP